MPNLGIWKAKLSRSRGVRRYVGSAAVLVIAAALGVLAAFALAQGEENHPPCAGQGAVSISPDGSADIGALHFQFSDNGDGSASFTVTGGSFTGTIWVKGGTDTNGGGHNANNFVNSTGGTVFAPLNPNTPSTTDRFDISHYDICVTSSTTTTTTTTDDTTTTSTSTSTETTTGTTTGTTTSTSTATTTGETTGTTTTTSTDETTTSTSTGETTGTTTGTTTVVTTSTTTGTEVGTTTGTTTTEQGGEAGQQGGGGAGGGPGGGGGEAVSEGDVAGAQAQGGSGELAFTGLGVPLLALLGAVMASLGLLGRRKLDRSP